MLLPLKVDNTTLQAVFPRLEALDLQQISDTAVLEKGIEQIQYWYASVIKSQDVQVVHGDLHLGNILWDADEDCLWVIDAAGYKGISENIENVEGGGSRESSEVSVGQDRFAKAIFQDILLMTISVFEHPSLGRTSARQTAERWINILNDARLEIPYTATLYVSIRLMYYMWRQSGYSLHWPKVVMRCARLLQISCYFLLL